MIKNNLGSREKSVNANHVNIQKDVKEAIFKQAVLITTQDDIITMKDEKRVYPGSIPGLSIFEVVEVRELEGHAYLEQFNKINQDIVD